MKTQIRLRITVFAIWVQRLSVERQAKILIRLRGCVAYRAVVQPNFIVRGFVGFVVHGSDNKRKIIAKIYHHKKKGITFLAMANPATDRTTCHRSLFQAYKFTMHFRTSRCDVTDYASV